MYSAFNNRTLEIALPFRHLSLSAVKPSWRPASVVIFYFLFWFLLCVLVEVIVFQLAMSLFNYNNYKPLFTECSIMHFQITYLLID